MATLDKKQTSQWDFGSIKKIGVTYWQTVVIKDTDIIICKVSGKTESDAITLAFTILDLHNNLL